jgi:hypothetical protein
LSTCRRPASSLQPPLDEIDCICHAILALDLPTNRLGPFLNRRIRCHLSDGGTQFLDGELLLWNWCGANTKSTNFRAAKRLIAKELPDYEGLGASANGDIVLHKLGLAVLAPLLSEPCLDGEKKIN